MTYAAFGSLSCQIAARLDGYRLSKAQSIRPYRRPNGWVLDPPLPRKKPPRLAEVSLGLKPSMIIAYPRVLIAWYCPVPGSAVRMPCALVL